MRNMLASNRSRSEPCSVVQNGSTCGETEGLALLEEFRRLYEAKLEALEQGQDTNKTQVIVAF